MALGGRESEAVPGLDPNSGRRRGQLLFALEVDGQIFDVRGHEGGTDYDWVNGPNKGYGFGTSARDLSEEGHREQIRVFLSMVDPRTGYIEDE